MPTQLARKNDEKVDSSETENKLDDNCTADTLSAH